jgi:hypothetical protein
MKNKATHSVFVNEEAKELLLERVDGYPASLAIALAFEMLVVKVSDQCISLVRGEYPYGLGNIDHGIGPQIHADTMEEKFRHIQLETHWKEGGKQTYPESRMVSRDCRTA